MIYLNDDWIFYKENTPSVKEKVRLPHTNTITPFNYFNEDCYQFVSVYEKTFSLSDQYKNKLVFLTFEGAAHKAKVYVNDVEVCTHNCGYTAFKAEISKYIKFSTTKSEEENLIKVVLDSRESLNVPPFGHVIDYLTYGGIYREVYLDIKEPTYMEDVFVRTVDIEGQKKRLGFEFNVVSTDNTPVNSLTAQITLKPCITSDSNCDNSDCDAASCDDALTVCVSDLDKTFELVTDKLPLWSIDSPDLCEAKVELKNGDTLLDEKTITFGIRTAVFEKDGFYLNGERVKIRGLNRHQSYPYVGYAMPQSMQEHDAYILKRKLGVNAVRTSHYPQSKYFLDACDREGLLVFTEAPGWQHIGDADWKKQHLENVKEMVLQYRNHPSIILWGVRINESQDDKELYLKANEIAHKLDVSRQTSGVRFIQMSQLLEDVYAFNDFSHTGDNPGLQKKAVVTPKVWKPYLISEYNGHMFPTKPYDDERHRLSHALRHANVLNSMYDPDNGVSGCFGWCMFDYNTHKDFGSGDKICYHGVLDMFRNPKLAASVYASQQETEDVCVVSSSMDIGEHPGGCLGNVYVFTNADFIDLYKNGQFVKRYSPDFEHYPNLPHPPVLIDDFIGCLLEENEGISHTSSEYIKRAVKGYLNSGYSGVLTPKNMMGLGKAMVTEKLSVADGLDLFYKYVGNWGSDVTVYRFDAVRGGKVVKSVTKAPVEDVKLELDVSSTTLCERTTYDVAQINFTALSKDGNLLNYFEEPISLSTSGNIELIGPKVTTLRGGMGGTYVRTVGKKGKGKLVVDSERFGKQVVEFTIEKK